MAKYIEFVSNYNDLSTEHGFQFEFECNRCGSGYRTEMQAWAVGSVANVLDTASSLFGGFMNTAATLGEKARSAAWQKAHDNAFAEAVEEIRPQFIQCPRCSAWVCRKSCWNSTHGLCKSCAPDLGVEMAAAQSDRSVEEIHRHARMADGDRHLKAETWKENIKATCPKCEAPLATDAKFCPNCGASLKGSYCKECGKPLQPGAKFCAECGTKT
ncbi:MAG: zinc ribbon domain-containing protein [bacterium]|jgi:membrane protease subunit (stomatin/prohibitin family)